MSDQQKTETAPKPGFSFGFSKNISSKPKFVPKVVEEKEEKDYIKDIKDGKIAGSIAVQEKVELVIPCAGNRIKFPAKNQSGKSNDSDATNVVLDEAAKELLVEAQNWQESRDRGDANGLDPNFVVPLKVDPDDKEFLDSDVASRAEISTLDDYESVPVEGFGMGMLRGMGFKDGHGIGGFKTLAVACIEPVIRPKGLGLGAAKPKPQDSGKNSGSGKNGQEEDLFLAKNCFVQIERGANKNLYGQVEGLDEETARVVVRLALGGQVVSVSENVIRVVSKKEFKEFGKILNKDSYEKYRDKQKEREQEWNRDRKQRDENRSSRKRSRSRTPEKKSRETSRQKSRSRSPEKSRDAKNGSSKRTWVRPLLRVRIVDKNYKSGKYFNFKVIVEDVSSNESCIVRLDSGSILDNVSTSKVETIIPKNDSSVVMIVRGSNRGQLAEILSRDRRSSRATVQVLPDKEDILRVDYDDICEYVGDLSYL